jgi:hypothetical protein
MCHGAQAVDGPSGPARDGVCVWLLSCEALHCMMASLREDAMTSSFVKTIHDWMKQVLAVRRSNEQHLAYWGSDVSATEHDTAPAVLVYATDQGWQRVRQRMYDFAC